MATQTRKRSTDESATFAHLFAEGDSLGTRCQKLKAAFTTLKDECEQQQQEWTAKEAAYVNEISNRDLLIQDLREKLLEAQNRSPLNHIEDFDKWKSTFLNG